MVVKVEEKMTLHQYADLVIQKISNHISLPFFPIIYILMILGSVLAIQISLGASILATLLTFARKRIRLLRWIRTISILILGLSVSSYLVDIHWTNQVSTLICGFLATVLFALAYTTTLVVVPSKKNPLFS
jgi:hypothetical protein